MTALLIRESYVGLFEKIVDNLSRKLHRMAISGNPGIGKSLFLFYVMWRISFMENVGAVVLRRAKDSDKIYIFTKSGCWYTMGNNKEVDDILGLGNTWYLTDTLLPVPGEVKAVTIIVSSPSRKHYAEFLKYSATDSLRYLPIWTLEELNLASTLYESLSLDLVKERYLLIGGIPRFVLEKFDQNLKDIIDLAITRLDIEKIQSISIGNLQNENDISHIIVHFVVNDLFEIESLQFSSNYVTETALDLLAQKQEEQLRNFISGGEHCTIYSGIRGNMFEAFTHRLFIKGGTFDCRSLSENKENVTYSISLPALNSDRFLDIKKCGKEEKYYIPLSPNYPCIDSFIPDKFLFQMTVSTEHPIIGRKMDEILSATKLNGLYFVVPRTLFSDYKKQRVDYKKYLGGNKRSRKFDFEQFVVAIDI